MFQRLLPLLLLTAVPTLLPAQRVVVVDAANGPGTNHTTLAAAFANLQANDYILLRAGSYQGAYLSTQHSFVLQGEGNPLIAPTTTYLPSLEIAMWGGQTQRIAIHGLTCRSDNTGQWAMSLYTYQNSWPAPTAHVENCTVFSASPLMSKCSLLAQAIGLTVQGCSLGTSQIIDCVASIVNTTITGPDLTIVSFSTQDAHTALDVIRSQVWIVDSTLLAGNSNLTYGAPASCIGFSDNSFTTASHVRITGNSVLRCDQSPSPVWPAPHVLHNYMPWMPTTPLIEWEPSVTQTPAPNGVVSSGVITNQRSIASALASSAPRGGTFTTTVQGDPNEIALVEVSLTTFAQPLLGYPVFLNVAAMVPLPFAVLGPSGSAGFGVTIPNQANLRGVVIEASAVTLDAAGVLEITNPVAGIVQ